MKAHPKIALDVMGGDYGAPVVLHGADLARERFPGISFQLFGKQPEIEAELGRWPKLAPLCEIVHTDDVVLGTDKPSQAVRRSKTSSMGLAISAVRDGAAHAAVSAGNTGALMASAKFLLRTMDGISRPALVALMPTAKAESVMLDLGANTECDAENLTQFAIMGAAFARAVLGLTEPRVALLNIGEEELKGTDELKEAAAQLKAINLPLKFKGFIEGDKIGRGDVDVIVTDGFTGNVALKTAEGTAKLVSQFIRTAFQQTIWSRIGYVFARGGLKNVRDHLDPNSHNGAVFLGLNGLVVKSHGGATPKGFANAIGVAHDLVVDDTPARIVRDLEAQKAIAATAAAETNEASE